MVVTKSQKKAIEALNYDLFDQPQLVSITGVETTGVSTYESQHTPLSPLVRGEIKNQQSPFDIKENNLETKELPVEKELPSEKELYHLFDRFNSIYFDNKLPKVYIQYSNRMFSAGSYTPSKKLIKIGRKYHELFPADLEDTLKHEMIHIIHFYHDADFKGEAKRIGTTMKARAHPELRKKPKYLYRCPACGKDYPRQKRIVMASCGGCSEQGRFDKRFKLKLVKQ